MLFYALTIFLSAFLLFQFSLSSQNDPALFGGSAAVWATCSFSRRFCCWLCYSTHRHEAQTKQQWILHGSARAVLFALPSFRAWRGTADQRASLAHRPVGVRRTPTRALTPLSRRGLSSRPGEPYALRCRPRSMLACYLLLMSRLLLRHRLGWSIGFWLLSLLCA